MFCNLMKDRSQDKLPDELAMEYMNFRSADSGLFLVDTCCDAFFGNFCKKNDDFVVIVADCQDKCCKYRIKLAKLSSKLVDLNLRKWPMPVISMVFFHLIEIEYYTYVFSNSFHLFSRRTAHANNYTIQLDDN